MSMDNEDKDLSSGSRVVHHGLVPRHDFEFVTEGQRDQLRETVRRNVDETAAAASASSYIAERMEATGAEEEKAGELEEEEVAHRAEEEEIESVPLED